MGYIICKSYTVIAKKYNRVKTHYSV